MKKYLNFHSNNPIIQKTTSLKQKITQNQSLLSKKKYSIKINTLTIIKPTINSL